MRRVIEGEMNLEVADGGASRTGHLDDKEDEHFYLQICSYDERVWGDWGVVKEDPEYHAVIRAFENKHVRVTIEVLDAT
jgi:hypothetical protein